MSSGLHASAVVIDGKAVLLRGPSGAGKSDLALRLIAEGAVLLADDRVELAAEAGRLVAICPAPIAGMIEVRGVGICPRPHIERATVMLVCELAGAAEIERLPEPSTVEIDGISLPALLLEPFQSSATAKIRAALALLRVQPSMSGGAAPGTRAAVLLITGISGAGKSTTLKLLEDLGYEAVDNLPLSLLPQLVDSHGRRPIAVGIDVRTRDFAVDHLVEELDRLIDRGNYECRLVYVDCDDETVARRYTETRRVHPLATDRPVMDGIRLERETIAPLRRRADLAIDTSALRLADLKRLLQGQFGLDRDAALRIFVTSFSYRLGLPRQADLIFDVRFLKNPHYDTALRQMTGLDPAVADHIVQDPAWSGFFDGLTKLLDHMLPRFAQEGKSYLTIGLGCTGGRHRSVFTAERLGVWLGGMGFSATVAHRDLEPSRSRSA